MSRGQQMNAGTLVLLRRRRGEGIQVLTRAPLSSSLRAPGGQPLPATRPCSHLCGGYRLNSPGLITRAMFEQSECPTLAPQCAGNSLSYKQYSFTCRHLNAFKLIQSRGRLNSAAVDARVV